MDGICGVLALDGQPLDTRRLQKMMAAIPGPGSGETRVWRGAGLMLAHRAGPRAPRGAAAAQPLVLAEGALVAVVDARIDGRRELLAKLAEQGYLLSEQASAEHLILASYRAWGEDCPKQLLGDYAFAIWDAARRTLLLARDAMGLRQLYYAEREGALIFGSTLGAVREGLPAPASLNRPLIDDFFAQRLERWVDQTVLAEVRRLPAAHALSQGPEGRRIWQHHVFGAARPVGARTEKAWTEAFAQALEASIRDRLQGPAEVCILTGAGLDSAALAMTAHGQVAEDAALAPVSLISARFAETPEADDSEFFYDLVDRCDLFDSQLVDGDAHWAFQGLAADAHLGLDEPPLSSTEGLGRALLTAAAERGCGAVLFGRFAEDLLASPAYQACSVLRELGWRERLVEARYFRRRGELSWPRLVFELALRPWLIRLFPPGARPQRAGCRALETPGWQAPPAFALGPRSRPAIDARPFAEAEGLGAPARLAHRMLRSPATQAFLSQTDLLCRGLGIEPRFPYLDLRLVELVASIPGRLWYARGEDQRILRELMRGRVDARAELPDPRAQLAAQLARGLALERAGLEALWADPIAGRLGFVDRDAYRAALRRVVDGRSRDWSAIQPPIWLEAWLRAEAAAGRHYLDQPAPADSPGHA